MRPELALPVPPRAAGRPPRHPRAGSATRRSRIHRPGAIAASVLVAVFWGLATGTVRAAPLPVADTAAAAPTAIPNAELLRPGLYRLDGAAGGTLLRYDATGLVMVAADGAVVDRRLLEVARQIAGGVGRPVDALVLTWTGSEQALGIARAVDARVPVIVQQRSLERLDARLRADAAAGRIVAFQDDYLLRAGGFEVEIEHVGRGRTGTDSVVRFGDLGVLAVGDLYTRGVPRPDCASGGSYAGWAAAIDHLMWFDFDLVVPSHGAPVERAELERFKRTLEALAKGEGAAPDRIGCPPPR